jgi:hypothetical protein
MTNDKFDKWIVNLRVSPSLQSEVAQREAENESARKKLAKRDGPKAYEKRMKIEAAKTAKLRALRLAKEADDRAAAALVPKPAPKRRRPLASNRA